MTEVFKVDASELDAVRARNALREVASSTVACLENLSSIYKWDSVEGDHIDEAKDLIAAAKSALAEEWRCPVNGYVCFYKGKRYEVFAKTTYEAQQALALKLRVRKSYEITVVLAEKGGEQVVHTAVN